MMVSRPRPPLISRAGAFSYSESASKIHSMTTDPDDVSLRPATRHANASETESLRTRVRTLMEKRKDFLLDQLNDPSLTTAQKNRARRFLDSVRKDIADTRYTAGDEETWRRIWQKWI